MTCYNCNDRPALQGSLFCSESCRLSYFGEEGEAPVKGYNRRWVRLTDEKGEPTREVLDTRYVSLTAFSQMGEKEKEETALILVLTRYPSPEAAGEAEDSLNAHYEGAAR